MSLNEVSAQKPELKILERSLKTQLDCVREDQIRKELYKNEIKAQERWRLKLKFLRNNREEQNGEVIKRSFKSDTFPKHEKLLKKQESSEMHNFVIQKVPTLSSGMVGWMAAAAENNLNKIGNVIYVSKKQTINPPKSPEEPDLNHQRFIILG